MKNLVKIPIIRAIILHLFAPTIKKWYFYTAPDRVFNSRVPSKQKKTVIFLYRAGYFDKRNGVYRLSYAAWKMVNNKGLLSADYDGRRTEIGSAILTTAVGLFVLIVSLLCVL